MGDRRDRVAVIFGVVFLVAAIAVVGWSQHRIATGTSVAGRVVSADCPGGKNCTPTFELVGPDGARRRARGPQADSATAIEVGDEYTEVLGTCQNGPHTVQSDGRFGIIVWGLAEVASYAYPAGGSVASINTVVVPANPH